MITGLRVVLLRDVRTYLANFYGIGFRMLNVFLDTLIFAFILTSAVPRSATGGLSYLQFFAIGSLVISIFWASYTIGRDVYRDRESGYLNYLMSLPISRSEIILGRSLGGSIRAMITLVPLFLLVLIIVPATLVNVIESLAVLFTFAIGLCGLGLIIPLMVPQESRSRLLNTLFSLVLIRASTAMYPIVAMPVWLQFGTKLNPVTYASDSVRSVAVYTPNAVVPLDTISVVLTFTAIASIVGSWLFSRIIEGGPAE